MKFALTPRLFGLPLVAVHQEVERMDEPGCNPTGRPLRVFHKLVIVNQCFGVKKRLHLKYAVDSLCAVVCGPYGEHSCEEQQGRQVYEFEFPAPQVYFEGDQKTLGRNICWGPTNIDPDVNLCVELTVYAYSNGLSPVLLADLAGQATLSVHVSQ